MGLRRQGFLGWGSRASLWAEMQKIQVRLLRRKEGEGRKQRQGYKWNYNTSSEAGGREKLAGGTEKCWVEKAKWEGSLMAVWQASCERGGWAGRTQDPRVTSPICVTKMRLDEAQQAFFFFLNVS